MLFVIEVPNHRVQSIEKYISTQRVVAPDLETGGQKVEQVFADASDFVAQTLQSAIMNVVQVFPFGEDRERIIMLKQLTEQMKKTSVPNVTMTPTLEAPREAAKTFPSLPPPPSQDASLVKE